MSKLLLAAFALGILTVGAGALMACTSATPTIRPTDYDQSCATDTDCVVVNDAICQPCSGPALPPACGGNAAINSSDKSRYASDFESRSMQCPSSGDVDCTDICELVTPYCNAGKCAACTDPSVCGAKDAGHD